ncbi:MAG TPA: hypothetical protein VN875_05665 [Candidatus Binatus sp.]|jgi:hypothetical protein|nr:hypothetical protein [Candidatus Binatus sp.]
MAGTISVERIQARPVERAYAETASIPWYIWCCLASVVSSVVGSAWDISWHESIGRDSFWTAAHMLIYLSGVLAGISCGYLILSTTFRKNSPLYEVSISMWGFRGPLGAFICAWGGVAMIASAPFDNWWHNSYGLDVKILSPPHVLLALGMIGIRFGLLVMVLAEMNRAEGIYRQRLERILFVTFVFLMGMTVGIAQEFTNRVFMHGAKFYLVIMIAAPIWIATVSWVAKNRWAATIMTAMFTALHLCFVWGFPLVPAEPKLGPVYQHITHLVPPDFPALLIIPAIIFDLLRQRTADWSRWKQAATLGAAYLVSFVAVQWPFASFLMSPASRNRIFQTTNYPYFVPPTSPWVRNLYIPTEQTPAQFWIRMLIALCVAILMVRIGMAWGAWMRRIRR